MDWNKKNKINVILSRLRDACSTKTFNTGAIINNAMYALMNQSDFVKRNTLAKDLREKSIKLQLTPIK